MEERTDLVVGSNRVLQFGLIFYWVGLWWLRQLGLDFLFLIRTQKIGTKTQHANAKEIHHTLYVGSIT